MIFKFENYPEKQPTNTGFYLVRKEFSDDTDGYTRYDVLWWNAQQNVWLNEQCPEDITGFIRIEELKNEM